MRTNEMFSKLKNIFLKYLQNRFESAILTIRVEEYE